MSAGLLRALVLAILAAALLLPQPWRTPDPAPPGVFWLDAESSADSLLVGTAPALVARESSVPPAPAELDVLAEASRRAPLYAALPPGVRLVEAASSPHPLAGRAAAVSFRVRGAPGDSARVSLAEPAGVLDSVRVRIGARGEAAGAFRVRPAAPGWREWTVRAAWTGGEDRTREALAGAWVDSAGPPRVLVRAGFPDWESKFVVRALEESGARVETSWSLGRGLAVELGAGASFSPARLAGTDAVVVLGGAPLGPGDAAALAGYAAAGGGVLLAGTHAGSAGLPLARGGRQAVVNGAAIRWSLPAELGSLPPDRVSAAALPFAGLAPGTTLAASTTQGGVLALRPLGRGRAAALALTETWRWRMEAGRVAEHREFWRGLVDWLASAPRDSLTIEVARPFGPPGTRQEVLVYDARARADAPVPPLVVTRPDRRADTLALVREPGRPRVWRASFAPAAAGVHAFALAGSPPRAGFRATPDGAGEADAWARLSLLAGASGGRALPADSLRPAVERLAAELPQGGSRGLAGWLLFGLLLIAAGAEWAIRRFQGRP
ncbi:MAG TPA: hypothetical protein VEW03_01840 [Longimicrobiaceae bacterium]|nr:hypothetical protein [Longimicrobiaceae bacterium]